MQKKNTLGLSRNLPISSSLLNLVRLFLKIKCALVFTEKLLESMDFQREKRVNYDPYHIISPRKQVNKNKPFDHQVVEGLNEVANLFHFIKILGSYENTSSRPITISQMTDDSNILVKRSLFEVESMQIDEDGSHKKAKLFQDDKFVSEIILDGLKRVGLVPTKSV